MTLRSSLSSRGIAGSAAGALAEEEEGEAFLCCGHDASIRASTSAEIRRSAAAPAASPALVRTMPAEAPRARAAADLREEIQRASSGEARAALLEEGSRTKKQRLRLLRPLPRGIPPLDCEPGRGRRGLPQAGPAVELPRPPRRGRGRAPHRPRRRPCARTRAPRAASSRRAGCRRAGPSARTRRRRTGPRAPSRRASPAATPPHM